ncbi:hypothetical protein BS17DRAFT_185769 [Gyrodon lividus]|nr:hypothetical protein BS17DRAFT_185769 [Gyrodon lividus]
MVDKGPQTNPFPSPPTLTLRISMKHLTYHRRYLLMQARHHIKGVFSTNVSTCYLLLFTSHCDPHPFGLSITCHIDDTHISKPLSTLFMILGLIRRASTHGTEDIDSCAACH